MPFETRTAEDGTTLVLDVPIFPTCRRGEDVYDEDWLNDAFKTMQTLSDEGHAPPVHVHHTGMGKHPEGAGFFHPRRIGNLRWRGKDRPCIYVDIEVTNDEALERLQKKQLPYRSVELDYDAREIVSLALLDSEAPYVEMPMTFLQDAVAHGFKRDSGTHAPKAAVFFDRATDRSSPVLCFARFGTRTSVLMEADMPDDEKRKDDEDEKMQDDTENGGEANYAAVCKAIESGEIPLEAFGEIRAAMKAAEAAMADTNEDDAEEAAPPAPSDNPPDVTMMERKASERAEAHAREFRLNARVTALEEEKERDAEIARCREELRQFAISGDPEAKLRAEYDEGAKEGGHKVGMFQLRHFAKLAKAGGIYPRAPGRIDQGIEAISDLPDEAKEVCTGDPSHDEAVARAHRAFTASRTRFSRTPFKGYWRANQKHFMAPAVNEAAPKGV